jgi:hypothetical protein
MIVNSCKCCGQNEIEWLDIFCQICWEADCDRRLYELMLWSLMQDSGD